jgi:hypothetical protein
MNPFTFPSDIAFMEHWPSFCSWKIQCHLNTLKEVYHLWICNQRSFLWRNCRDKFRTGSVNTEQDGSTVLHLQGSRWESSLKALIFMPKGCFSLSHIHLRKGKRRWFLGLDPPWLTRRPLRLPLCKMVLMALVTPVLCCCYEKCGSKIKS